MDTLVAENFVYENTLNRNGNDANTYLVKGKNFTQYIDQIRGQSEYVSSKVIIDAQTGNTTDVNDWSNVYVTMPWLNKLQVYASGTANIDKYEPDFLMAPKNCSIIESMRVEQGGRVIIQDTGNLSHLVSFIKHQTTSATSLNTQSGDVYYPDGEFSQSLSASIAGVRNVSNSANVANNVFNEGALMRQKMLPGNNRLVNFVTLEQGTEEQATQQSVSGDAITGVSTTAAEPTLVSETHYLAVIYLRDLSDYFAKHPLSRGGYKFTFTVNQAISKFTTSGDKPFGAIPTLSATSLIGGSTVQPCMATIGPNTVNSSVTGTNVTYNFTLTSRIDISDKTRQSGCLLWVPSLTLSDKDEAKLLSQPIINRNPFMINSSVYANNTKRAPINLQLFNAVSNPRALIIIPQLAQYTQTQASQASPLDPCPGVPNPLSLTKIQIRVNSKPILPAPINYGWNAFIQNTAQLFTVNGGVSSNGAVSTGMINLSKWMNLYRYYAFDLSLMPADQRDIPQLIAFEAFNNSNVDIDLYVYVLYEEDVTFNLANATVRVGM